MSNSDFRKYGQVQNLVYRPDKQAWAVCVENDTPIPVAFDELGEYRNFYNETLSLAGGASATAIITTVAAGEILRLRSFLVSCDSRAFFTLKINGQKFSTINTSWLNFNAFIELDSFKLFEGDVFSVTIENKSNQSGNFHYNLLGRKEDA
jgi:hypothetical protein